MGSANHVGALTPDYFSRFAIASVNGAPLSATGNAVVALPFLFGGLTNTTNTTSSGQFIVRQITFANAQGTTPNTANVAIYTSNDGNASNIVTANTVLTNLAASTNYQDVAYTGTANTCISAANTQAFFLCVNAAGGAGSKVDVTIYGDLVTF